VIRPVAGILLALAALAPPASAQDPAAMPKMPGSFEQIGHEPLMNRGMNAALAVLDGYAYVGSRTDGSHANAGVMVVDVRDPAKPKIVKEMGPPDEGLPTQTSREMRILPDQKLLIVLNHQCSELIHRCATPSSTGQSVLPSNYKFFDIAGPNAADPKLVATYTPSAQGPQTPHEFYIWNDPKRPSRVLMYMTDPASDPEVIVADLSHVREGKVEEIAKFTAEAGGGVHSITVSHDGRRMFLAALTGGFLEADTSEVADGKTGAKITQLTASDDAPVWPGPGAHSAIRVPRTNTVMITDEVYGYVPPLLTNHGCPWGWVRFIDDANPAKPTVISEYRLPINEQANCGQITPARNSTSSWAAHNPTLTEHLAILSWHSAGLQAIDTSSPVTPSGAANWSPTPLPVVQTEDPLLSSGQDKVVVWSFPVIVNGLIYVVDLRNGLYILRYHGPHEAEVSGTRFLDGNSNSGDAARLERPNASTASGPERSAARPRTSCLAGPIKLRGRTLGPFRLGMTRSQASLRGGPPSQVRKASLTWCVEGGGKVAAAFNARGRVAFVASTTLRGRLRGGRRAGARLVVARRGGTTVVAGVRRGAIRFTGVAAGRPSTRELTRLVRAAGL
jgi:hypothetical protein